MALTMKQLEALWPEGPLHTYEFTMNRLLHFEDGSQCPLPMPESQQCWDVRLCVAGLLRLEVAELKARRPPGHIPPVSSWLLTSRAVNHFCCVFLDGVR